MRHKPILLIILAIILMQTGCLYVARDDGPYIGKVVDQETREPIEGVVVLGTWYTVTRTVAGGVSHYYDASETVTDKNGDFEIPGKGLLIMGNIWPMRVFIFKAGYSYTEEGWDSLKLGLNPVERIKWEGDKPIFAIKKLTIKERSMSNTFPPSPPSNAPKSRIKRMMEEIYKERAERGLNY